MLTGPEHEYIYFKRIINKAQDFTSKFNKKIYFKRNTKVFGKIQKKTTLKRNHSSLSVNSSNRQNKKSILPYRQSSKSSNKRFTVKIPVKRTLKIQSGV